MLCLLSAASIRDVPYTAIKYTVLSFLRGIVDYGGVFCYRATLCVSAVRAVVRCPSVRPSVTFVYCIQTVEDIVILFLAPVAPSLYFLATPLHGHHGFHPARVRKSVVLKTLVSAAD